MLFVKLFIFLFFKLDMIGNLIFFVVFCKILLDIVGCDVSVNYVS